MLLLRFFEAQCKRQRTNKQDYFRPLRAPLSSLPPLLFCYRISVISKKRTDSTAQHSLLLSLASSLARLRLYVHASTHADANEENMKEKDEQQTTSSKTDTSGN